jgi:8-amino-7-oxononanoate synthase
MSQGALRHLGECLADLERRGLLRERPGPIDRPPIDGMLHLCSNDYLGYRTTARLDRYALASAKENPAGAGASRLVAGEHAAHRSLERALSRWLAVDETLVFSSGYLANSGTIAALAMEDDVIVSDVLNHASIIDGCRLSRARCVVVPHNTPEAVRDALRGAKARRRWVVTESYFSMEGDSPDLRALRGICDEYDAALIVDEAHALGVTGPGGRGGAGAAGVQADVLIGTLGKALGAQGAFVAGSTELCRYLWNRARSFVFSTGLSPMLAAIAEGAVEEAVRDDAGRGRLRLICDRLRFGLHARGIVVANREGPILPIVLGSESAAMAWSRALGGLGILVQAIRPPTVPARTARLRVTARANLTEGEVDRAIEAFGGVHALSRLAPKGP